MIAITDDKEYSQTILNQRKLSWNDTVAGINQGILTLADRVFGSGELYSAEIPEISNWPYMLISRSSEYSQYDIVNELCQKNVSLPHGILCFAGQGKSFHGFKKRAWSAPSGNIYLTAFFAPDSAVVNFGPGFMALAAVSVMETIDSLPGLHNRAKIKWINDIFIDGAKVGGVLAHSHQEGDKLTGVALGIGLNVKTAPAIEPTFYVPKTVSLYDYCEDRSAFDVGKVLYKLIENLHRNYKTLSKSGFDEIISKYRQNSLVIGREVEIRPDNEAHPSQILAAGVVKSIGDGLELYLEDTSAPVTSGRLILK